MKKLKRQQRVVVVKGSNRRKLKNKTCKNKNLQEYIKITNKDYIKSKDIP
jgi:hypothetical protein